MASDDERIAKYFGNRRADDNDMIELPSGTYRGVLKGVLIFLLGISVILLIWQGFAWYYNEFFDRLLKFPYPLETLQQLWDYLFNGKMMLGTTIYVHLQASLTRWITAFLLATFLGLVLGMIIGYFSKIYPIMISPINIIQMIPGMAWLPVALLMFGLGDEAAIFIIFIICFVIITINVSGGIRKIPDVYIRTADMMGAPTVVRVFKVILPCAALDIVNGLRMGMGSAWRVLISAEMVIATGIGIGYAISGLRYMVDYAGSFACIAVICCIGLIIDKLIFVNIEKYMRHKLGMDMDV